MLSSQQRISLVRQGYAWTGLEPAPQETLHLGRISHAFRVIFTRVAASTFLRPVNPTTSTSHNISWLVSPRCSALRPTNSFISGGRGSACCNKRLNPLDPRLLKRGCCRLSKHSLVVTFRCPYTTAGGNTSRETPFERAGDCME